MRGPERILVIKFSALGDFVLALPAFARIRAAHPGARVTLLTTPPFETLARASPYFDEVRTDGRPNGPGAWLRLARQLRCAAFDRVYDLQTNDRTNLLFQALRPGPPPWSGTAFGCSLPHRNRDRASMHPLERQAEQLRDAGIWPDAPVAPLSAPGPDLSWIVARQPQPRSERPTALLAPGSSARHPRKRWPAAFYARLAAGLEARGFAVVVVGGIQESSIARAIQRQAPRARDLTGRTDFAQIAALGARAALAVGNDTGPIHLIAAAGAPTLVLFSSASSPALNAPRGRVAVLQAADLAELSADKVLTAALALAAPP